MRQSSFGLTALFLAALVLTPARPALAGETEVRQIVQMLDYLGRDYGGAVQGGKVISDFEYQEQIEFANTVAENAVNVPALADDEDVLRRIGLLQERIEEKVPADEITQLTQSLRESVIAATNLPMVPDQAPDLSHGAELYAAQCISCHGASGAGDGPAGVLLKPAPANFLADEAMKKLTPFQAFNTIRNGVKGTGMPAYPALSQEDIWDISFYLFAMRHADRQEQLAGVLENHPAPLPSLSELATAPETELMPTLAGTPAQTERTMAALRLLPGRRNPLETSVAYLDAALRDYDAGKYGEARKAALAAYLEGIEPVEPQLMSRDARVVADIEKTMIEVRNRVKQPNQREAVVASIEAAKREIAKAERLLSDEKMSYWAAFTASLLIMLREGFEAVLIVAALFAVLRRMDARRAQHWTHIGWVSALIAGVGTWYLSEGIVHISGANREIMEGAVALVAVAILIYMGFWLHSQAEIQKWASFVNEQARKAIAERKFITFFGIAFLAVYREAFETVLFYRALSLGVKSDAQSALALGLGVGIVGIAVIAWAMLRFGARVPLRQFFKLSAGLLFVLTVVLLGKGIHSLQEAGVFSVTSFPVNLRFTLLGVYPTYETLLPQILLAITLFVVNRQTRLRVPGRNVAA